MLNLEAVGLRVLEAREVGRCYYLFIEGLL